MSKTTVPATITADPDVPTITMTREFDAPVEKVFRAFTEKDLYARWVGPHGYTNRVDSWDASTGGHYRFATLQDGEEVAAFYGSFHEIRPNERIVQTFTWLGMPDGVSLETATFEDLGGGRCRVSSTSVVDSFEGRDAILSSGMEVGVNDGYEKLDALLTTL